MVKYLGTVIHTRRFGKCRNLSCFLIQRKSFVGCQIRCKFIGIFFTVRKTVNNNRIGNRKISGLQFFIQIRNLYKTVIKSKCSFFLCSVQCSYDITGGCSIYHLTGHKFFDNRCIFHIIGIKRKELVQALIYLHCLNNIKIINIYFLWSITA